MKRAASSGPGTSRGGKVTLARALSKLGIASRAEAARMILRGDVRVKGRVVRTPGSWVDPGRDAIVLAGKPLARVARVYLAMHKPAGIVTTRSDEKGRGTVYDLLPEGLPWVFPVGRLDLDSTGLLLFTNDTEFGERVTGPEGNVPKTYNVLLESPLGASAASAIREGIMLPGNVRCRPAQVTIEGDGARRVRIVISEGKNRQVRRMFESVGNTVLSLHRTAIGGVEIGGMKEGEVRPLTPEECALLSGGNLPGRRPRA